MRRQWRTPRRAAEIVQHQTPAVAAGERLADRQPCPLGEKCAKAFEQTFQPAFLIVERDCPVRARAEDLRG